MKTVDEGADAIGEGRFEQLSERTQEAFGELAGAAKEGLALGVGLGLGVLHELMAEEVDEVVGPKGKQNLERRAKRHRSEAGSVTLGGRRVPVTRPRVSSADDEREVPLETYQHFADRDPLTRIVLEQKPAGVSTRRLVRTREPFGEAVSSTERSASKSAVSRAFVARTGEQLAAKRSSRRCNRESLSSRGCPRRLLQCVGGRGGRFGWGCVYRRKGPVGPSSIPGGRRQHVHHHQLASQCGAAESPTLRPEGSPDLSCATRRADPRGGRSGARRQPRFFRASRAT